MTSEDILKAANARRESMSAYDKKRDKGLTIPDDIKCIFDIPYSKDDACCQLDVYRPKESDSQILPVIASVHGGGWIYGDKELYSFYCMELARRGFAVVNFTYRLTPEHKYPSALVDTNNAFKWILKNSAEYNFDCKNIFATGDSAGGNYLATYGTIYADKEFAKEFPFKIPAKLKLNALYLNCGVYDFMSFRKTSDDGEILKLALMPNGGAEEELLLASPIFHITENFPPTFVVTAEADFLRMQAPPLAKELAQHCVEFQYKCYSGKRKKLEHVFMLNLKCAESAPCIDEQCEFFKKALIKSDS